jgi:hypothetical protein
MQSLPLADETPHMGFGAAREVANMNLLTKRLHDLESPNKCALYWLLKSTNCCTGLSSHSTRWLLLTWLTPACWAATASALPIDSYGCSVNAPREGTRGANPVNGCGGTHKVVASHTFLPSHTFPYTQSSMQL